MQGTTSERSKPGPGPPCMKHSGWHGHGVRERTRRAGTKVMRNRPAKDGRASRRRVGTTSQPHNVRRAPVGCPCAPRRRRLARVRPATQGEKHGQDRVLFLCEKKAARTRVPRYLWSRRVQSVHCQTQVVFKFSESESDWTRTRPDSRVGPLAARAGSDRDGRERPADGHAGPFRPERTPFFPSHFVPSGLQVRSITG
jgi:hypothetical protein